MGNDAFALLLAVVVCSIVRGGRPDKQDEKRSI